MVQMVRTKEVLRANSFSPAGLCEVPVRLGGGVGAECGEEFPFGN